ncbi:MAG: hypothetical protein ACREIW_13890 [Chthoniobacterales bacterium]
MSLIPQVNLPDEDKLETLRELDQFRHWRSLDDQRYCLVCGRLITGRQIKVIGESDGSGRLRLSCPTEGCNSIPMDWMLPTDEVLASAKEQTVPIEEPNIAVSDSADQATRERLASHLRKFAFHFKRAS